MFKSILTALIIVTLLLSCKQKEIAPKAHQYSLNIDIKDSCVLYLNSQKINTYSNINATFVFNGDKGDVIDIRSYNQSSYILTFKDVTANTIIINNESIKYDKPFKYRVP